MSQQVLPIKSSCRSSPRRATGASGNPIAENLDSPTIKRLFGTTSTPEQPMAKMIWVKNEGGVTGRVIWQEGKPPKGAQISWKGDTTVWHRVPANEVDGWVEKTYEELARLIQFYLDPANEDKKQAIVRTAQQFIYEHHTFDRRVQELFKGIDGKPALLELAKHKITNSVALQYIGRADSAGGILGKSTGRQYVHEAGKPLIVDVLDAPYILQEFPTLFRQMGVAVNDPAAQAVERMG